LEEYYKPPPKIQPVRTPRLRPRYVLPSMMEEPDLIGDWIFYLGSGDLAKDYSPEENHGDITDAVWEDGPYGWGLYFNNTSAYVDCGSPTSLEPDYITIIAWINRDSTGDRDDIVIKRDPATVSDVGYGFTVRSDDALEFFTNIGGDWSNTVSALTVGTEWTYVACYFDGSDAFFRANENTDTQASDVTGALDYTGEPVHIGRDRYEGSWFGGSMKFVQIYGTDKPKSFLKEFFEQTREVFNV